MSISIFTNESHYLIVLGEKEAYAQFPTIITIGSRKLIVLV
jgi:hypothetical protein